jgi:MoaA/NifB/PqqE/SkfB family radical SAM enzyme
MKIKPELLSWAQIDITARCQAMCLDCARNINGVELNPEIGTSDTWDMPIEILKKFLSLKMLSSLERIRFNGNFGDSLLHQDFFNILKYVVKYAHKNLKVSISTNGAMFDDDYYRELYSILKPLRRHRVIFALDGLEDTHHIYRRGTKFQDVIDHATAFIKAGGRADWQFIEFDHNKHQLEEAKQLARELKFEDFQHRHGSRNFSYIASAVSSGNLKDQNYGKETKKEPKRELIVKNRQAYKEMEKKIHEAAGKTINEKLEEEDIDNVMNTVNITCSALKNKGLYLEYDGTVNMCCWLGDQHKAKGESQRYEWNEKVVSKYGNKFNNLHYHTLNEILNHDYFVKYLPNSWGNTMQDKEYPRLETCSEMCGGWGDWNKQK